MHKANIFQYETIDDMTPKPEDAKALKDTFLEHMISQHELYGHSETYSINDLKKAGLLSCRKDWMAIDSLMRDGYLQMEIHRKPIPDTGYKQANLMEKMYSVTESGKNYFLDNYIKKRNS